MAFGWKLYGDGKTPPLGEAVAPDERLSWPLTIGIGAQHVVAMFGATFLVPIPIGLVTYLYWRKSTAWRRPVNTRGPSAGPVAAPASP